MSGSYQRSAPQQPPSFSPYPKPPYIPSPSAPFPQTSPYMPPASYQQTSPYAPTAPYQQNSPYASSPKVYSYMPPVYSSPNPSTPYGGYPAQPAPPVAYTQQPSPNTLPPNQPNASTDLPPVKRAKYTGPRPELNEEQKAGRNLLMKWKDLRRAGIEVGT